jgi:DNA-binding beta-propeller fold protein YncE
VSRRTINAPIGRTLRDGDVPGCHRAACARASRVANRSHIRSIARRSGVVHTLLLLALLASSSSALARPTHVFARSITPASECALSSPGGIAVNEATGDIYVVDRGHQRVVRFGASGECLAHFKVKVAEAEEGTVENSSIAVDNNPASPSFGDVYVVANGSEPEAIQKYEAGAKETANKVEGKLSAIKTSEEEELFGIHGVAVDATGNLYVYQEEGVVSYDNKAPKNKFLSQTELEGGCLETLSGFAVAPAGEAFYLAKERESRSESCVEPSRVIAQYSSGGSVLKRALQSERSTGAAVDLSSENAGDVYVQDSKTVATFTPTGALVDRFGQEAGHELQQGTGIAIDSATREVLVAEALTGAIFLYEEPQAKPAIDSLSAQEVAGNPSAEQLSAQIDPKGSDTHYFFQYGTADCAASPALCSDTPAVPGDLGSGFGDRSVSVALSGLKAGTDYFYRVIATNSSGSSESQSATFQTLPSTAYLPDARSWELVSPAEKGGGSVEPPSKEGGLIQAAADGGAIAYISNAPFGEQIEGNRALEPNQIVSTRSGAGWSSRDIATENERGEGFRAGAQREYQAFSPDLSLALLEPQPGAEAFEHPPLSSQASERTIYRRDASACASSPAQCFLPLVSASSDTAEVAGEKTKFGGKLSLLGQSPDLAHAVLESKVGLTADAPTLPSEQNLYEWSAGQAPSQQLALVNVLPSGAPAQEASLGSFSKGIRHAVSDDGSRVFWMGLSENPNGEVFQHLFMRDTASAKTIQIDAAQGVAEPKEEPESEEQEFQTASANGERAFFTYPLALTEESTLPKEAVFLEEGSDLYVCELPQQASNCNLKDLTVASFGESADVLGVLGASEDGTSVYFVANGVLSTAAWAAGARPGSCGGEHIVAETCSLYVDRYDATSKAWQEPHFIATLSSEDEHDWLADNGGELQRLSSRVSPNGHYLAFMSSQSLTGYDNRDANPLAHEARDQEVFLYDASQGRLSCASCNPSGARPHGVYDTVNSGEGLGLVVDRPEAWTGRWLAGSLPGWTLIAGVSFDGGSARYQSRYLSDSGRLFFNGADALIPQGLSSEPLTRTREQEVQGQKTQVGVENVYQYEPKGVGGCQIEACVGLLSSGTSAHESAFLDASESGDDAFFTTAERLVATDQDTNYDVYDARVCTASSPCLTYHVSKSTPCESESSCRGPQSSQQDGSTPASATFSGAGNIPTTAPGGGALPKKAVKLTRAQKLKRALKACRKKHNKHKRAACERQARKKYAAKHKGAAKKAGKR